MGFLIPDINLHQEEILPDKLPFYQYRSRLLLDTFLILDL